MSLLIKNIKGLVQFSDVAPSFRKGEEMKHLPVLEEAWIAIKNGLIEDYGLMTEDQRLSHYSDAEVYDASGRFVFPSWIDAHTHLVFAETREAEFVMKIAGYSYEQIAREGGGILNSVEKLRKISEDELFIRSYHRLLGLVSLATGAIEIKSGYGLNTEAELKMLRVVKRLRELNIIPVKSTFLGAHAIPKEFKHDKKAYIRLLTNEMIPEISKAGLADYIDIFIEEGFFSVEDAEEILEIARKYHLKPRLHVDQMTASGGLDLAIRYGAISADHLEQTGESGINMLKNSQVIPVLLPSCSFYLRMKYPDARKMIDSGLGVVIASDFNPGSSPSGNLNFSLSLACIQMRMFPEEAVNALTVNAAHALELKRECGFIGRGARANLFITAPVPSIAFLPYYFGRNLIEKVIVNGKFFDEYDFQSNYKF